MYMYVQIIIIIVVFVSFFRYDLMRKMKKNKSHHKQKKNDDCVSDSIHFPLNHNFIYCIYYSYRYTVAQMSIVMTERDRQKKNSRPKQQWTFVCVYAYRMLSLCISNNGPTTPLTFR